jgi:thiamine-monophosphate kinase
LQGFSRGLKEALARDGVVLIGGDTTQSDQCTLSLQIIGEVPSGKALLRSGATAGDGIYVTGNPGDAAAGLRMAINGAARGPLYQRFARSNSRVAYAQSLRDIASAAIDVSDGLYADLCKLLTASGKGAVLHIDRLPLSAELLAFVSSDDAIEFCLSGGDDYEVLFTSPTEPPMRAGTLVTRIGEVVEGSDVQCFDHGKPWAYSSAGYQHFQ